VATVSMMVLLTLVAIAMLSLSTIEQRSSGGGANEADRVARANARMALMMALGELQKAAGPDQRVTATASILGDSNNLGYSVGDSYDSTTDDKYIKNTTAVDGKKHWVGVWYTDKVIDSDDTGDEPDLPYSPATADQKRFVRWLVSGDVDNTGDDLDSITAAGTAAAADDVVIFEGVDASGNPDPDGPDSVKVPKVEVATTSGDKSYYAYWVEDQGVKADLEWNETLASDTSAAELERAQARRLSASPGPDYGVLGGPFASGVTYPLKEGGSNSWLEDLEKAFSPADMGLVMGDSADQSEWLKVNRHDIGMHNRGVLADVKKGGLRRDLSLAFEMDGDADFELTTRSDARPGTNVWPDGKLVNPPTLFNLQDGEFVGGNDKLQALWPQPAGMSLADNYAVSQTDARDGVTDGNGGLAPGMPVKERYLYRVSRNDGSPFSDQLKRFNYRHSNADVKAAGPLFGWYPNSVVRGPNWWSLRDYYNLYKRVTKSGSAYSLESRAYYPNNSAVADTKNTSIKRNYRAYGQPARPFSAYHYDMESSQYGDMVFKPAKANYTPVYMGMVALYSMKVTNVDAVTGEGDLTVSIDPMIYLWNPFNVTLKADRFALELQRGHGGKLSFVVVKPDGTKQKYGPAKTDIYIQKEAGGAGNLTYLVRNLVMEPGEVMILSPGAGTNRTALHDEATAGTNLTDLSGISTTWMPKTIWNGNAWEIDCLRDENGDPILDGQGRKQYPNGVSWIEQVKIGPDDTVRCLYDINYNHSIANANLTNSAEHFWMATFLPNNKSIEPNQLFSADWSYHSWHANGNIYADRIQQVGGNFAGTRAGGFKEYFIPDSGGGLTSTGDLVNYPETDWPSITLSNPPAEDSKFFFGINCHILKPANYTKVDGSAMPNRHAVEVFSQFNPYRTSTYVSGHRANVLNEAYSSLSTPGSVNDYIQEVGIQFPTASGQDDRGNWGETMHNNGGSTSVPFAEIPTAPILSLVDFANANLSLRSEAAYKDVGNSHASIFVPGNSIYGNTGMSPGVITTSDNVWLINDALFDRYYLSGIAPEFAIDADGYSLAPLRNKDGDVINNAPTTGESIKHTLDFFYNTDPVVFGSDYSKANANPALVPYLPQDKTSEEVVDELMDLDINGDIVVDDGYKKLGAYSLVKGAFNVNSTSVKAWESLLRANKNMALANAAGTDQAGTGTPFSGLKAPVNDSGADTGWDGFSRLTDAQITSLATEIVNQVKARGPFMSISDFVNRQVSSNTDLNASGAIQSALDTVAATQSVKTAAGGLVPYDPADTYWHGVPFLVGDADMTNRRTTEGIAGDIRQAEVLRALAPRLSARTDTFRIRGYGEVTDSDGNIIAKATCEAVVQRLPEYVDPETNSNYNEPWDEYDPNAPANETLNSINQTYGRRFEIRSFRWLDDGEV